MEKNKNFKVSDFFIEEIFNCECYSPEHTFNLFFDKEKGDLYLEVFLSTRKPWYERIWPAIKYIFGYRQKYGHFDECIINKDKSIQLYEIVKKFKEFNN